MSHPSEGLLRRAIDEPAALGDDHRRHVGTCADCRAEVAAMVADRDAVGAALDAAPVLPAGREDAPVDVDAAWRRFAARLGAPGADDDAVTAAPPPPQRRMRTRFRRPAVAVAAAAVFAVGTTAAAAAVDWLPIFKPDQVTAVTVDLDIQDVDALPDLSAYGTLSLPADADPRDVADAAEARRLTGIDPPDVAALPRGVGGEPTYGVLEPTTARFTFSAEKARASAERTGRALPPMPAGVDGSTLEIRVGPGVVTSWGDGDLPEMAVIRMAAPVVSSQGVSLPTLRDYLLAQPGIPADVADKLRELPDDGSVLPVPVPSEYATTETTTVDGERATAVTLRDGSAAGLTWIKDGELTAVFGLVDLDDLKDVANGLS
jgi:hypothetical protein